jgi:hypothetical protein
MRNPVQEYNIARSMPIQALAAVLQGKSDMVSLGVAHAALKEKMEAEVAKKGASAMQMAQAPKVKDKDLAMAQGLGASPADIDVPMGGIVGGEGTFGTGAAGGGSVVAFQTGGLGALNMSGNELKNFIDAMTKKGVPPAQVNQIAQQAQAVAANNPGALRSFLKTAASRFGLGLSGGAGAMMGFTDALVASEKGGRPVTGATPGYNYPAEEMISGVEPGVVGPSTNKSSLDQLFSNIGAIMPSGIGAETYGASDFAKAQERIAQAASGQGPDVHSPKLGATETRRQELLKEAKPEGGLADIAAAKKERDTASDPFAMLNKAQAVVSAAMGPDVESAKNENPEEFMTGIMGAMKKAGVDFDMMKNQIADLRAEKEKLKGSKSEAANLRLLEAGLGILGGESPYAFVNIGKGASPALKGFAEDIKDIQKQSRMLDKETRELARMQNELALGTAKFGMESYERKQDRVARAQEAKARNKTQLLGTVLGGEYQLKASQISAAREGDISREISQMPGKTRMEKVQNFYKASTRTTDPAEAAYAKMLETYATEDPGGRKLERLKESNPALYARIKQDLATFGLRTGMITEKPSSGQIRN